VMSRALEAHSQGGNGLEQPIIIKLVADGRELTEVVYKHLPGIAQGHGVRM